jgi:quercetin dioxygenase-like cupin family protein
MTVITPESAPTFDISGASITGLASPSRGARETAAWRIRFDADHRSPVHSLDREEVFVVLEGAVTVCYDDHEETAGAGGALIVPAGVEFSLVAREAPAEAVCLFPVGGQATTAEATFTPPWAA